jgi:hypothetical protein
MVDVRFTDGGGGVFPLNWPGGGAEGGGANDSGLWDTLGMEPDVFVRCTPGGPVKPWPGAGGPGKYDPELG